MKTNEALDLIGKPDFLDKVYKFAYHRCDSSHEAEDLCSDIVLEILSAVKKKDEIDNFYAFVWTVAHRVYADYCEKRRRTAQKNVSFADIEGMETNFGLAYDDDGIRSAVEGDDDAQMLSRIQREISFLSKMYRDIMVMYYLDEMKLRDIAKKLGISENTVKQRLFSARNTVRKEVERTKMDTKNLSLKPVELAYIGSGMPVGNDPTHRAQRILSKNIIYLCKEKPRDAKELAELLGVPMLYIEEELEIQCRGLNGTYGMLRRLDNGKYTINVIVASADEYKAAADIFARRMPEICEKISAALAENRDRLGEIGCLNDEIDDNLILWTLLPRIAWNLKGDVGNVIREKYFSDVTSENRPFTTVAYAWDDSMEDCTYGNDGIGALSICGYSKVNIMNMYGRRIAAHFHCGHDLATDMRLILTLRSIGGLSMDSLTEDEREIAAKAIEAGYIRRRGDILEPAIVVAENSDGFNRFASRIVGGLEDVICDIAKELAGFMREKIPEHLMGDYGMYVSNIAGDRVEYELIECCIERGLILAPENTPGSEGVLMIVEK